MERLPILVEEDPWLYKVARVVLTASVAAYGRFTVVGAENLPLAGPAILIANHHSDVDPVVMAVSFARPLHFMADVEQLQRGFVGPIIKRLGAFPVYRDGIDRRGLLAALDLLRQGVVVAMFPEGDMYPDGQLRPFERGVGFLAVHSGAPIIPAAIIGAEGIRRGGGIHRPPIRFYVGPPVELDGLRTPSRATYGQVTLLAHESVRRLHARR